MELPGTACVDRLLLLLFPAGMMSQFLSELLKYKLVFSGTWAWRYIFVVLMDSLSHRTCMN